MNEGPVTRNDWHWSFIHHHALQHTNLRQTVSGDTLVYIGRSALGRVLTLPGSDGGDTDQPILPACGLTGMRVRRWCAAALAAVARRIDPWEAYSNRAKAEFGPSSSRARPAGL